MGFLPVIVGVEDSAGVRIDAQRSDGTRAPIVLQVGAGFTSDYEFDGGLTRVFLDMSASAFYEIQDDGAAVPARTILDFVGFTFADSPTTTTIEVPYFSLTGTDLTIDEAALTSLVLGHVGAPVEVVDDLQVGGNLVVTGDLTVEGTTTTLETSVLDVEDRVIHCNHSTGAADPVPALMTGLAVHRGAAAGIDRDHAAFVWEESTQAWRACYNTGGDDATVGADKGLLAASIGLSATAAITIDADATAPVIAQANVSTGDAQELTVRASGTTDVDGDGGHLWARGGAGGGTKGVGGDVNLVPGNGSVLGKTRIWDGAETEVVTVDAATMDLAVDVVFAAAHVTPSITQAADTGTGVVTADALTMQAQGATGDAGANAKTGGNVAVVGGDVTGTGSVNTGGVAYVKGGLASGGTANVGGDAIVGPGPGTETNGAAKIQNANEDDVIIVDDSGVAILGSGTAIKPGTGQTVGATTVTLVEVPAADVPDDEWGMLLVEVIGADRADAAFQRVSYWKWDKAAGVVTAGGEMNVVNNNDIGAGLPSVAVDTTGAELRVRATGVAGITIDWKCGVRLMSTAGW